MPTKTGSTRTRVLGVALALLGVGVLVAVTWVYNLRGSDEGKTRDQALTGPETSPTLAGSGPFESKSAAPADSSRQAPRAELRGVVVDPEGKPVPGARISLWRKPQAPETETDGQGRFVLPASGGEDVAVRAQVPDRRWVAPAARLWLTSTRAAQVTLVAAREVRVTATADSTGEPIAGALVRTIAGENVSRDPRDWRYSYQVDEGRTDALGRAVVRAPTGIVQVYVTAPGFGGVHSEILHVGAAGLDVALELPPAGTVEGQLLTPDGAPFPGALLHAVGGPIFTARVNSDAEGRFRFVDVPAMPADSTPAQDHARWRDTKLHISVRADGWAPDAWACELPGGGEVTKTQFVLRHPRKLQGTALLASGEPAQGIRVWARPSTLDWFGTESHGDDPAEAESDADGRFLLSPVTPGKVYVTSRRTDGWHFSSVYIHVPAEGAVPPLTLRQEDGGSRSCDVLVVGPDGELVPGAGVDALEHDADGEDWDRVGYEDVDRNGVAHFAGGLPAGPVTFTANATGYAPCKVEIDLTEARSEPVEIRFPPGRMAGRVTLPSGEPAKLKITLTRLMPDGTAGEWMTDTLFLDVDADGRFACQALGEASYRLSGWTDAGVLVAPPSLRAGMEDLDLRFVPNAEVEQYQAEIALVDAASGAPLTGAIVVLASGQGAFEERPGRPGTYRSSPIVAGQYGVRVVVEDRPPTTVPGVQLVPGGKATTVRVRLALGGTLEGRVLTLDGTPVADCGIFVADDEYCADESGRFRIRGLPAGTAQIKVAYSHVLPTTRSVSIQEGEVTKTDFRVRAAGRIVLRSAARHDTWGALRLSARQSGKVVQEVERRSIDWDGQQGGPFFVLMLESLPPGAYEIELSIESGPSRTQVVEVEPLKDAYIYVDR